MFYALLFIIGLAFGSFASVIIHRLHAQEGGIVFGRSKCPHCAKALGALDLIPVVSYIANRFKCRHCKGPISSHYPLLELSMGAIFVITGMKVGMASIPLLVFYLAIAFAFIILTFYDFLFKEVPDEVVLPAAALAFAVNWIALGHPITNLVTAVAIPVLFFSFLFTISKGNWLGGGDIRIGALMGAMLGWPYVLIGLFLGYVLGAIFSLIGLAIGQLHRKSQIPFAPFLLLGTFITMFWGQKILEWYLNGM